MVLNQIDTTRVFDVPPQPVNPQPNRGEQHDRVVSSWVSTRLPILRQKVNIRPGAVIEELAGVASTSIPVPDKTTVENQFEVPEEIMVGLGNDSSTVSETLRRVGRTMNLTEAATTFTRFIRENQTNVFQYDEAIAELGETLKRIRGRNGNLSLTSEDARAVGAFFSSLEDAMPRVSSVEADRYFVSAVSNLLKNNKELIGLGEGLVERLLLDKNGDNVTAGLKIAGDTMEVGDAANIFATFVRENPNTVFQYDEAIHILSNLLKRRKDSIGSLTLTTEENEAIAGLFTSLRGALPLVREMGAERYVVTAIQTLLNDNHEVSSLATDLIGDLLLSPNSDQVSTAINIVNRTLPISSGTLLLSRFIRENHTSAMSYDGAITALGEMLSRRRNAESSLTLTTEENEAIAGLFTSLRGALPLVREMGAERYVLSSLHSLLNRNKELSSMAKDLIGDCMLLTDNSNLGNAINIVRDTMSVSDAVYVFNRLFRENHTSVLSYDEAINALKTIIINSRLNSNDGALTVIQRGDIAGFFSALREAVPFVEQAGGDRYVTSALRSFIAYNKDISGMAVNLVGDFISLPESDAINNSIAIAKESMSLRDATTVFNRLVADNQNTLAVFSFGDTVAALRGILVGRENQVLMSNETEALSIFFTNLRNRLPTIPGGYEGDLRTQLQLLINDFPQVRGLANELTDAIGVSVVDNFMNTLSNYTPGVTADQIAEVLHAGEGRITEVNAAVSRLGYITAALIDLPEEQIEQIRAGLANLAERDNGPTKLAILEAIFTHKSYDTDKIGRVLQEARVDLNSLPELLNDETIIDLVSVMADNPKLHRYRLGVILSQISLANIPDDVKVKLKPIMRDMELKIKPEHGSWWLCGDAEPRLLGSMDDGAVILVNDIFLVKFKGKLSGLCLQTTTTRDGMTFIEGNWYSPSDAVSRNRLKSAFDGGHARLEMKEGEWSLIRPIDDADTMEADRVFERAREYAANMPDTIPEVIGGDLRAHYREIQKEDQY